MTLLQLKFGEAIFDETLLYQTRLNHKKTCLVRKKVKIIMEKLHVFEVSSILDTRNGHCTECRNFSESF